ncbi:MAG: hypothetical protein WC438_02295 [Candidatus Pacearchaeota archaeon]
MDIKDSYNPPKTCQLENHQYSQLTETEFQLLFLSEIRSILDEKLSTVKRQ